MEKVIFNPLYDKYPKGASLKGTDITYTIKVSKFEHVNSVKFVMHLDGRENAYFDMHKSFTDDKYSYYTYTHKFDRVGLYWYHFRLYGNDFEYRVIRGDRWNAIISPADNDYLQVIYSNEDVANKSFRQGIIYHIFVDRFKKSGTVKPRFDLKLEKNWKKLPEKEFIDGKQVNKTCYGGNIKGIIEKLNYLKLLNVSTIYLSPILEANSSHKYDVADYMKIDSMFGTEKDFKDLINQAKKLGIKIILDMVFNHTGSDSVYFNKEGHYNELGAYQSKDSKYYSWYNFIDYPYDYLSWWGIKTLPTANKYSGFRDLIVGKDGVIEKYMKMGVAGIRLDVVDELPNDFVDDICKTVRKVKKDALIVGEVWEDATTKFCYNERKKYFLGGELNSVMNYPIKNAILDYVKYGKEDNLISTISMILDQYPKFARDNLMNILSTHDTIRAITYLGMDNRVENPSENYRLSSEEYSRGIENLKMASLLQYTMVGIPTVFYGDEAGIEGMKDPYSRATYPWGKEEKSLIEWYQKLGNLYNHKVFDGGDLNIIHAENSIVIYERVKDNDRVIVMVNKSFHEFRFALTEDMTNYFTRDKVCGEIVLMPMSCKVFVNE